MPSPLWPRLFQKIWNSVRGGHRGGKGRQRLAKVQPRLEELESRLVPTTPNAMSIVRATPPGPTTNAASVIYTVNFNQTVTGVDPTDFRVTASGSVAAATPVAVSGSGSTYTVAINGIHGTGNLRLDLIDDDSIQAGGIPLGGPGLDNGSFQGQTYSILQTYPSVMSINRATPTGPVTSAGTVAYTVTFSEPVTGVDPTDFQLAFQGTVTAAISRVTSVSPSVYTVTVSGISGTGTLGLNLVDNGSIRDVLGNPLTLPSAQASFQGPPTYFAGVGTDSLVIGDANGDSKPDLVVADTSSGTVGVLLGNGNGSFRTQQTFTAGSSPFSAALADVNGDGKPDIIVSNLNAATVSVLLGNGNGTFQARQSFAVGKYPFSVAIGDVNGDGRPDIVVSNFSSATVSVLMGNGNGTFQAQATFAAGSEPTAVAIGDLNGDGKLDIVVPDSSNNAVDVLLGNGNGTFETPQTFGTGAGSISVAIGDVNADGRPDLVVTNQNNGTAGVLLGNGNGTFQAPQAFAAAAGAGEATLADVNGDGNPDIVTANNGVSGSVSVLLGNGNGTFQPSQNFATGSYPKVAAVGDVNGDGKLDIVTANSGNSTVTVLSGNGNGTFQGQQDFATGTYPFSVAVADVNGDGKPDAVVANFNGTVSVLLGNGNGSFQAQQVLPAGGSGAICYAVVLGDVNGDGIPDIVVDDYGSGAVAVLLGNGNGSFQAAQFFAAGTDPNSVALADVNSDGKPDLVVTSLRVSGTVNVLLGNGNGTFQAAQTFASGSISVPAAPIDVNGDGIPDVIALNGVGGSVSVLLGNGNGTFRPPVLFGTGPYPQWVAIGDLNGDGKPDLLVANRRGGTMTVLLGAFNGNFTGQLYSTVPAYVQSINRTSPLGPVTTASSVTYTVTFSEAVTGVDPSDFQLALTGTTATIIQVTAVNPAVYTVTVGGITGNGTIGLNLVDNGSIRGLAGNTLTQPNAPFAFLTARSVGVGGSPIATAVGDVNGDGIADIVAANSNGSAVSLLLGNGNGTFQAPQLLTVGQQPLSVVVGDVNGDGLPDLVVANDQQEGTVSVLLGNGNGTFQTQQVFGAGSFPQWVALGDVNGDGLPDLAVANLLGGTVSVLLGNGNGTFQAQQGLATGANAKSVVVGDVNGDGKPDLVVANQSNNSAGVFLGNGNGTFQAQQTFAAGSSPFSVVLSDVNGDGQLDVVVANSTGNSVSVLLGNGNGTFQAAKSFSASSNPQSLVVGDVNGDGKLDIVTGDYANNAVSVLLGNGDGTFQALQSFATGSSPRAVALGDFNGDGRPDLVVGNTGSGTLSILLNAANGNFTGPLYTTAAAYVQSINRTAPPGPATNATSVTYTVTFNEPVTGVVAADFAVVGTVTATISLATPLTASTYTVTVSGITGYGTLGLNLVDNSSIRGLAGNSLVQANPGFSTLQTPAAVPTGSLPAAVATIDVNGDGKPDLVVADSGNNSVSVLLGNGDGTFQGQSTFATGAAPVAVAVLDLNGDGQPDLAVANSGSNTISVLLGNGNGTFQGQTTFAAGADPVAVAALDLNGDGKADLVVANVGSNTVSVLLGNGNGTFQSQMTFATGTKPVNLAVVDVFGNGKPDLAVTNEADGSVSLLLGNGNGTFANQGTFATGANPVFVATADLNGDGTPDLVVANQASGNVGVLLGNGNGSFQKQVTFAAGSFPSSVAIADVNGDGNLDLVATNEGSSNVSVLLGNGNGTFQSQATFAAGANPVAFAALDVSGDARPDVVVADQITSNVSVLLNSANGSFAGQVYTIVQSGGATHFAVSGTPANILVGTPLTFTVTALDQFNSTVAGYVGTVHFTSSDGKAVLPADATLVGGVGIFSATLATAGSQSITAADSAVNAFFGTSGPIAVTDIVSHFALIASSNATAGNAFVLEVAAEDPFNNAVPGYSGTVQFTSSDPQAVVSSPTATLTGGVAYLAVTLKTAGNQTLTATDATTGLSGASNAIVVSPAAAFRLTVTIAPPPSYAGIPSAYPAIPSAPSSFATTGNPLSVTVTAVDFYGNTVPTYAGTVHFTSSDTAPGVHLPPNSTLAGGVGLFSATLATAGTQSLTAADIGGGITGTSSAVVTRGLVVTGFTPTPSGFTITFNQPFNANTVNLYTSGSLPDDVILATNGSQVSVRGSVVIDSSESGFTFVKTATASAVGAFNPASGLLAAGNYTVTLRSFSSGSSGFQDALGGSLDGTDSGIPGTNYKITFAVSAPPVAVGIPDFARGPSNTDALFLGPVLTNGSTFALSYDNPAANPANGTATVTFSTTAATLQTNIQSALTSGGLTTQVGIGPGGTPNSVAIVTNDVSSGANVLVTFQNALAQAASQLLTSTTPGVSISVASINVANNIPGSGIPIALSSGLNVTSGSFTLQYNPALLTISGVVSKIPGASFTLSNTINNATSATAVLSLSSPSPISSTASATTLGSLLATVPLSATTSYGTSQLLHFSSEQLHGTAGLIPVTNEDGLQVAAYLGDVTDNGGPFTLQDATAISAAAGQIPNTIAQTLPGFAAFPTLDPVIVGDVALQGSVNSTDAGAMNQEVGGNARVTIPYAPIGLPTAIAGPDLTGPPSLLAGPGSTPISSPAGGSPIAIAKHAGKGAHAETPAPPPALVPSVDPTGRLRVYNTLDQVVASLAPTGGLPEDGTLIQPGAILTPESDDWTPNHGSNLAVPTSPAGLPQGDWLSEECLTYLGQAARSGGPASVGDFGDEEPTGPDAANKFK